MPENNTSQKTQIKDRTTLIVSTAMRDKFKIYCIKNKIDMQVATDKILSWAMKRKFKSFSE